MFAGGGIIGCCSLTQSMMTNASLCYLSYACALTFPIYWYGKKDFMADSPGESGASKVGLCIVAECNNVKLAGEHLELIMLSQRE